MATGKDRATRESRERARIYEARRTLHDAQERRRRRDNVIVSVAAGLVILGAIGAQALYYTTGPGAPEPDPASSQTPAVEPTQPPLQPAE